MAVQLHTVATASNPRLETNSALSGGGIATYLRKHPLSWPSATPPSRSLLKQYVKEFTGNDAEEYANAVDQTATGSGGTCVFRVRSVDWDSVRSLWTEGNLCWPRLDRVPSWPRGHSPGWVYRNGFSVKVVPQTTQMQASAYLGEAMVEWLALSDMTTRASADGMRKLYGRNSPVPAFVCGVYWRERNVWLMLSEYVEGTLLSKLQSVDDGWLMGYAHSVTPPAPYRDIHRRLVRAVAETWALGWSHSDLHSNNVMVTARRVVLLDWGRAVKVRPASEFNDVVKTAAASAGRKWPDGIVPRMREFYYASVFPYASAVLFSRGLRAMWPDVAHLLDSGATLVELAAQQHASDLAEARLENNRRRASEAAAQRAAERARASNAIINEVVASILRAPTDPKRRRRD